MVLELSHHKTYSFKDIDGDLINEIIKEETKIVTPFNKECKRGKNNCGHSISVHNKHETIHAMVKNILAEDVIACHAKLQTNH